MKSFSYLCDSNWLFDISRNYCDYDYSVDCGDRPLCDANDQNCVERKETKKKNRVKTCVFSTIFF